MLVHFCEWCTDAAAGTYFALYLTSKKAKNHEIGVFQTNAIVALCHPPQ